jgi:oligopeptide transport system permease protein
MTIMGAVVLAIMMAACLASLPYTLGSSDPNGGRPRYAATNPEVAMLPPFWAPHALDEREKLQELAERGEEIPRSALGTDRLGRSLLARCLAGGTISLTVGLAAAAIAVIIGTLYGTIAGACGGRIDAFMMRIVDVLFGLPYILLVVLLAVAVNGLVEAGEASKSALRISREALNLLTLLVAIGGVSWLTMARVIRGQVLSLKQQPFMEACRAIGMPLHRQFSRHLLPNLLGPIIAYATLTVPAAILSESFLSFLGIGIQEPLPSWGNLAAAGLSELNMVRVRWWVLLWPCLFIAMTLLALNFVGEGLRERFDPRQAGPAAAR